MAIAYSTTVRNNKMDQVTAAVDGGAGAGLLRIYDGTRPASGGTATTLLAELTLSDPSFGAAASGVITANSITGDTSANATGTATWFRIVDSNGTFIIDGSVGTSGSDLNLDAVSITTGDTVNVSSLTITENNS